MLKVLLTIYFAFRSAFKSQSQLEAEIVSLRHQLNIALRKRSCRVSLPKTRSAWIQHITDILSPPCHVRYWHKADIIALHPNVRFRG